MALGSAGALVAAAACVACAGEPLGCMKRFKMKEFVIGSWAFHTTARYDKEFCRTYMAAGFNQNRCWVIPDWRMVIVRAGTNGGGYPIDAENEFLRQVGLALDQSADTSGGAPRAIRLRRAPSRRER